MRLLPMLLLAATLPGCAPSLPAVPQGERVSYSRDVEPLVVGRCIGCHSSSEPRAELVLESGEGYRDLVGQRSVQAPGMELVAPGDPESSYLWRKLEGRTEVGKGMPRGMLGYRRLPEAELERIRRWIEDGARP